MKERISLTPFTLDIDAAMGKLTILDMLAMTKEPEVQACFETTPRDYTCLSCTEDCRCVLEQVPGPELVYDTTPQGCAFVLL